VAPTIRKSGWLWASRTRHKATTAAPSVFRPLPAGFSPQVQDAFGEPGPQPTLGPNEITAFDAIGYDVVPAPLIGFGFPVFLGVGGLLFGAKLLQWSRRGIGLFDVA